MDLNLDRLASPPKRRRLSQWEEGEPDTRLIEKHFRASEKASTYGQTVHEADISSDEDANISISATSKQAGQTVAPFLAKHIPDQYAPLGSIPSTVKSSTGNPNTKYCYRHRPDLKCRRQVDEPSMEQLQHELEDLSQADQQAIAHVWSLFSAAPSKHRNLMLRGILSQCCFPQLSFLSTNVRELIRIDFLTALPPEISFKILCRLDTVSLCKAAQVSRRWRTLADDDVVWHRMCEQHIDRKCTKCGWGLPLLERKRLRASKRQIQLRATGRGLNEWSPQISPYPEAASDNDDNHSSNGTKQAAAQRDTASGNESKLGPHEDSYFKPRFRPWKDVYRDRFKVGSNWKYGRCSIKTFKGHSNGVTCLQFDEKILATGSYDATIKIWDLETCKEIRTLRGHTSGIRCLQFDDTKIISGSIDRSLKVWNWRTGECLSTYTGHGGGVIGLHFDSAILASASTDSTVKIWNFEDRSTFVLRGHTDWVNAVKVDSASRTVFSSSDDCTIKLWDLDTKQCIKSFEGHVGQVQQVLPLPPEFDIEETDIDEPDTASSSATPNSQPSERGHGDDGPSTPAEPANFGPAFSDRPLPPRYMLTSALDSTIRLWDVHSQKCLRTYFGHVEGVWALAADTLRVVSGAEDRMVKVWDARSGKCERTFTGHAAAVTCVGLSDRMLCTGSEDCEVRMYSF
ncbi:MAG: hypothetical protein LQ351_005132 [Letrouitia transgressa]|nr:MAG: hypothetical protein LQ351_005132 [Letrouitia transgressa]